MPILVSNNKTKTFNYEIQNLLLFKQKMPSRIEDGGSMKAVSLRRTCKLYKRVIESTVNINVHKRVKTTIYINLQMYTQFWHFGEIAASGLGTWHNAYTSFVIYPMRIDNSYPLQINRVKVK